MHILSIRAGDKVRIGEEVALTVTWVSGGDVRIVIDAPVRAAVTVSTPHGDRQTQGTEGRAKKGRGV